MTAKTDAPTFAFDESKFKELMLYVAARCQEDSRFGATKLNKILYYADALHYAEQGEPITGATYVRRRFGQAPKALLSMQSELIADRRAALRSNRNFGQVQKRLVALTDPDLSSFKATEIETADEVIEALWERTASEVSQASHRLMGWKCARDGEEIPYHAIFLVNMPLTDEDREWALEIAEEHGLARDTQDGS